MPNYLYKISEDSDYLMHHGIKGQKWGVENGPPYPLDSNISTGRVLKKADKNRDKSRKQIMSIGSAGTLTKDLLNNYSRTNSAKDLSLAMTGVKATEKEIEKFRKLVSKYPKKAKDAAAYAEDARKAIDIMLSSLDEMKQKYGVTKEVEDRYNKFNSNVRKKAAISDGVSAGLGLAAGGVATVLAGPIAGLIAGPIVWISGDVVKNVAVNKEYDKLQEYLDERNKQSAIESHE